MTVIRHGGEITLAFWECGHVEIDRGKEHPCPLDVCRAEYRQYAPATTEGAVEALTELLAALYDVEMHANKAQMERMRDAVLRAQAAAGGQ